jgi:nitroreductase
MKLAGALTAFDASGVEAGAKTAPVTVLLSADFNKGKAKMAAGTESSTYLEGGHIGENMYLEAESLKLSLVVMGGGLDAAHEALQIDPAEKIVYIIPVGQRAPDATPTPVAKGAK